jgi:AraC-like DNA-binding protein
VTGVQALADLVDHPQITSLELTCPVLHDAKLRHALATLLTPWDAHTLTEDPALLEEQLAQACGLLVQRHGNQGMVRTGSSLSAAALDSGFADQSHLTRSFVRHFGFTPGVWQRAHAPSRA